MGFVGCCICVLASQKSLLKFLSLQNQPGSLAPGSASVELSLRCCTCSSLQRHIRKTYCQIRLAVAFSSILVLPLNAFVFLRMLLIHSRWREAVVEGNAISCQRLASTLAWDKVLFHLDIIPFSSLQHAQSVFSCYLERLEFCSKEVVAVSKFYYLVSIFLQY